MPNLLLLISVVSIIFFNSCGSNFYDSTNDSSNRFYVVRMKSSREIPDAAEVKMIGETDHLIIYAERGYNVNYNYVNYVAKKFEDNYSSLINIYGNHTDVDKNGKIIILLIKINDNISSGDSIVMGYFLPSDLFDGEFNNAEILYMDINILNANPRIIAGTVLHEFQHLINFNVNDIQKASSMSLWLNESLSESTSVLFDSYTADARIEEFNEINYYCFYTWELPYPYSSIFANYPSASVFMNWLYIKNCRNSDIFKRIASSSQTQDYNKVLYAASGNSWENLLKDWINGVRSGQVVGAKISNLSSSATLYPGAVIWDGSQVRVNSSTELTNLAEAAITVSKANSISGRSAINNNEEEEISLQSVNNNKPKYIDLVFDRNGKVRKY